MRKPWTRIKHHYVGVTIAAMLGVIIVSLVDLYLYPMDNTWLIELGCMAIVLVAFVGGRQHAGPRDIKIRDRVIIPAKAFGGDKLRSCDICLVGAFKVPDNPQAVAEKRLRRLKLTHYLNDVVKWWGIIVYIAVDLAVSWLLSTYVSYEAAILVSDVFLLGLVYVMMSIGTHTRLQGWCPMCGNGGEKAKQDTGPVLSPTPLPA